MEEKDWSQQIEALDLDLGPDFAGWQRFANQTVFPSGSSDQGVFADCLATAHGRSYGQSVRAARAQASLNQLCGIQQSLAQGGKPDDCHG